MKNITTILLYVFILFSLSACGEQKKESNPKSSVSINPVDAYVDSRVNALDMAKNTVKESNKQTEQQNKALEKLTK